MPAPPLCVDPLLSFARVDGDVLRVVLVLSAGRIKRRHVWLRFQGENVFVRTPAEVTEHDGGQHVEASIARSELPDGIWRLKLRVGPNVPLRSLRTRLVVNGRQPVALLPRFGAEDVGT